MPESLRSPYSINWIHKACDVITGCTPISEGCNNCIADRNCKIKGKNNPIHENSSFSLKLWPAQLQALTDHPRPTSILIAPRGDLFHDEVPAEYIHKVLEALRHSPRHEYYLLTKRPVRMFTCLQSYPHWPLPRVNVGVSAENQNRLLERMPSLLQIEIYPPAFRYLSLEPLLEPVHIGQTINKLGWIVYGAERGVRKRPAKEEWFESIREEAQRAGIPSYHHYTHNWLEHQQKPTTDMKFRERMIRHRLREYLGVGTRSLVKSLIAIKKEKKLSTIGLSKLIGLDYRTFRSMIYGQTIAEQSRQKAATFVENYHAHASSPKKLSRCA